MDNSAYIDRAEDYDCENEHKSRTMLKKGALVVASIAEHTSGHPTSILEVGCGTGLFTRLLAERFPHARITASDAFAPMLEIAKTRLNAYRNVRLEMYDAEAVGNFGESFDIVCGVDLIHHLNNPVRGLKHWREMSAPAGALIFFESNPRNPLLRLRTMNRPEEARFKYNTRTNLHDWATTAGWHNVEITYAPIHLPNGPRALWGTMTLIENAVHPLLWPISGGMVLYGKALPSHSNA